MKVGEQLWVTLFAVTSVSNISSSVLVSLRSTLYIMYCTSLTCFALCFQVEAINQKRTIAFINHFITHTSRFLNRFSCVCEEKLETLHGRIQQLEVSLSLLEAKVCLCVCVCVWRGLIRFRVG